MKICKYCGTEYDDGLDKCPNCGGNKVFSARELEEEANQQQKEIENQERAAAAPAKKKNTIIGVIAAVVVVIAAIAGFSIYKANQPLSNGMTKDEAQGIFDSGVAFMDAGQYEDAIDTFLQLPSDSKQYTEAQELLAQSQDSYRADIISRVDSQVANGDYDSAFSLVEKAQSILPGDAELQESYDNICTAYRADILSRVDSQVASGNYESAFGLIEEGQNVLPGDSELQGAYDNTYSAYCTAVLAKADEYSQSGQYKMALEYLNGVQTTFSDDAQIQDAYDNINLAYKGQVRAMALTDADNYVASADYVSAINTLNSAIDEIGQDEEVAAKLNIISNDYATSVIDAAKTQYIEYDADSIFAAEDMIEQALGILPDNEALSGELAFYKDHEPIPFFDIALADFGWQSGGVTDYKDFGAVTDNQGVLHNNSYSSGNWYTHTSGWHYYTYWRYPVDLDYQYSRFTGTIFQSEYYAKSTEPTSLKIEGFLTSDVYTSDTLWGGEVSGESQPMSFDIDISGLKYVLIRLEQEGHDFDAYHAYLTDLYIWK